MNYLKSLATAARTPANGSSVTPATRSIESLLSQLGAEVAVVLNSSRNLADKIDSCQPEVPASQNPTGSPDSILGRLESLLEDVRTANNELNRAHQAVNG